MEEISLLKDFAVIMVVAGVVTLIFRQLRQPVILGYLIAGLLIGPYTLPFPFVTNLDTINLLADLGIVLLIFAIGLEFSWNKIRKVGMSVILIGCIEIITMISLGYVVGKLLGWSGRDALFLGAALHISSSAIIVKVLRDMGRLHFLSSRLIVGILVVEDFAAVAIVALLSQIASTGVANLGDIGVVILRLVIFILATLVIGRLIVPRLMKFVNRFQSKEVLLITGLGLCFALALLGNYLGLSVAAGAFLMGTIIGDTDYSMAVTEVIGPVRDMFAALFFVSIGMLINIDQVGNFIIPALIVFLVFVVGKVFINTVATFLSGHDGRTSLNVGMGMPQIGEFSLIIAKTGVDRGIVVAPLYPVIALVTAFTSFTTPYIMRSSESVTRFLNRKSPLLLKAYISRMGDWLEAIRKIFSTDSVAAHIVQHATKSIVVNALIIVVLISIGTFALGYVPRLSEFSGMSIDIIGLLFSLVLLILCLPCFAAIWRNVRNIAHMASGLLINRTFPVKASRANFLRIIIRDTVVIILTVLVAIWFIPYLLGLFALGSFALVFPLLFAAIIIYIILWFAFDIHGQLERAFSQIILGKEHVSPSRAASMSAEFKSRIAKFFRPVDKTKNNSSREPKEEKKSSED